MEEEQVVKKSKNKLIIISGIVIAAVIIILAIVLASGSDSRKASKLVDAGNKYIENLDFDNAILTFEEALKIDDKNVEAYIGIVKAYIGKEEYIPAHDWAVKGFNITQNEELSQLVLLTESYIVPNESAVLESINGDSEEVTPTFIKIDDHLVKLSLDLSAYSFVSDFHCGMAVVSQGELYGVIDINGNLIIPLEYHSENYWMAPDDNGHIVLSDFDEYYLFDKSGNMITFSAEPITRHQNFYLKKYVYYPAQGFSSSPEHNFAVPGWMDTSEEAAFNLVDYEYYTYDGSYVLTTHGYYFYDDAQCPFIPSTTFDGKELLYNITPLPEGEYDMEAFNASETQKQNAKYGVNNDYRVEGRYPIREEYGLLDTNGNVTWYKSFEGPVAKAVFGSGSASIGLTDIQYPQGVYNNGYVLAMQDPYFSYKYALKSLDDGSRTCNEIRFDIDSINYPEGYYSGMTNPANNMTVHGNMTNFGTMVLLSAWAEDETTGYLLLDLSSGSPVTVGVYDTLLLSEEKYWLVSEDGKWGFTDHRGNIVNLYQDASEFAKGYAAIIEDGVGYIINDNFEKVDTFGPATRVVTQGDAIFIYENENVTTYYVD